MEKTTKKKVYVLIKAIALPGKLDQAPQAALESVEYLNNNANYVGTYEIVQPISSPIDHYYWLCEYASLADFEKDSDLRTTDAGWSEAWKKIAETIVGESITSQILRVRT